MKQLVEFRINDGEREYTEFGIYDKKYSDEQIINNFWFGDDPNIKDFEEDENTGMYWDGSRLVSIYTTQDIHGVDIKILEHYRVAYEHNI
jgi:hypothetical protein